MAMTSQFCVMVSSSNFDIVLFLLSHLVIGPSFMSISSLVMELRQFSLVRDWLEIGKSEITPSEFCPISGDWGKLWILNLARISLIDCYWMLQNSRVTAYTDFELLRENQLGRLVTHEAGNSYIYQVFYQQSCFASFVVKRKFAKTSKSLKILWQGLYFKFVCTFYVFINSSIH